MRTMKRWSQDRFWAPEPRRLDTDLVESFAYLARDLPWPHGPLSCGCCVCSDARAEVGIEPGLIDPWDLIGARWLP